MQLNNLEKNPYLLLLSSFTNLGLPLRTSFIAFFLKKALGFEYFSMICGIGS
jgi:hypothetical protein